MTPQPIGRRIASKMRRSSLPMDLEVGFIITAN